MLLMTAALNVFKQTAGMLPRIHAHLVLLLSVGSAAVMSVGSAAATAAALTFKCSCNT